MIRLACEKLRPKKGNDVQTSTTKCCGICLCNLYQPSTIEF